MDKPELLARFREGLESFEKFQGFIEKARAKADKFPPEVVERVVRDNSEKIEGVAAELNPLVAQMQAVIDGLEQERKDVQDGIEGSRIELLELELRAEIGELEGEAFDEAAKPHQEAVANGDSVVAGLEAELAEFRDTLAAWLDARPAGDAVAADTVEHDVLADLDDEAFGESAGRGEGVHAEVVEGLVDDVSAVFDDPELADETFGAAEETAEPSFDEEEVLEAGDADMSEEGISFGEEDLGEPVARPASGEVVGTAALILGEGTDEEHVYPYVGEVISLGRGRDNTVQVKNDSKVSRYHCKLFQRDNAYFIEDNKSANGTLVDGELITEKRLLGGEEIIIGESFFRFRIHG